MSRSEVRVGQIWFREVGNMSWKVKILEANRTAVTYQVIETRGQSIEHGMPITVAKSFFLEQFTRVQ